MHAIPSYWEPAINHRELSSELCNDLEGWGGGKEWEGGDICIPAADSLCCTPEANTTL